MREGIRLATGDAQSFAAREIVSWGRVLLALGAAMVAVGPLVSMPWSIWGMLVLGVGALAHLVRELPMLLVCGIVLVWAGLSHLLTFQGQWGLASVALMTMGLTMMWRFHQCRRERSREAATCSHGAVAEATRVPSPLLQTFPFLSYGLGIAALIALPLAFVCGLTLTGGRAPSGDLLADLLNADTALAALGLALGCAALPDHDNRRRALAVWGMVGSSVVLVAFLILVIVALAVERL